MHRRPLVPTLLFVVATLGILGGHSASAQSVRVEAGGGWAIPSSEVSMRGTLDGEEGQVSINPRSGPTVYGAVGLVWTLSENFDLEGRLRAQHSRLPGSTDDFAGPLGCTGECTYSNDPDGRLRAASFEGRIVLTSVGRINPYFLVGLGIAQTTVEGVLVTLPDDRQVQFSEVDVTDAGGDVGFGATTRIAGGLFATAEVRATGSLPGSKENAITAFPFTLGVSYEF